MTHQHGPRGGFAAGAALGAWALAMLLLSPSTGKGQVSPEESAKKLRPADGLEAKLWAAEPMVVNPTNMDVDSRGRVWVTEGLNYRLHRNKGKERQDRADRIKILEDTDGDGKADKVTVFADEIFPVPMGLAVEEHYSKDGKYEGSRVYVGNSPDLLVLEDTDGDDKADKRSALLTGFGGIDSDHGVHGMVLGLDGKLYFTHGDGCCSVQHNHSEKTQNFDVVDRSGRHVSSDQLANTLRVNRDGTEFEVLADRQRNNYETSLDSFGNVFTSDNDDDGNRGCRVIWVVDGGHYGYRTPGSPRHWGEDVPGNVPKLVGTGNGSPCGITVYEGSLLPEEYRGAALEAEAGTRQINVFPLTRQGASFRTDARVLLRSDDPWFRPVDMTAAPDGSVFVADWYDAGVGGHSFRDQTTGRIYRLFPKGSNASKSKVDFGSVAGLIHALRSPTVATQDAARRGLIEHAQHDRAKVEVELVKLFSEGQPHERARALWVLHAVAGDRAAINALKDSDPRIREQAVRILGRDDRENGRVEYERRSAKRPPAALEHLAVLLPMASDPDASVRRELILALRNVPTEKAGDALLTLARTWDGQDRWYLEALGLALDGRESSLLAKLFDGTLYGDLQLDKAGQTGELALPPYFPADRNEAYIPAGAKELPASPLSKTIGLAWRLHKAESLDLLAQIAPKLEDPDQQQALDDVVTRIDRPEAARLVAKLATESNDPIRKRQAVEILARKLPAGWRDAAKDAQVVTAVEAALKDPETKAAGLRLASATGDARYAAPAMKLARDAKAPEDVRVAAVETVARLDPTDAREFLEGLIAEARERGRSDPAAESAVRQLSRLEGARKKLAELFQAKEAPLSLRREALRSYALVDRRNAEKLLDMARDKSLPDDLKTEATVVLHGHPDDRIRRDAPKVLPLPKTASGRELPSIHDLLRRDGKADHGRDVFFRTTSTAGGSVSCGGCHRVQGQGRWIGPDLSTIGTKYGKDELLRSILNPSAAIGYNFRSVNVATKSGQVYTGLAVEDASERLVLKTADGQRVVLQPSEVEERRVLETSLMPDGLAETMSDQDLVDLLAFLSILREPVSIVGEYHAIGPVTEANGSTALDPLKKVDLSLHLQGPEGQRITWRRVVADAEGTVDLGPLAGSDESKAAYVHVPLVSSIAQDASLVFDTKVRLKAWVNGRPLELAKPAEGQPIRVDVDLPKGSSDLLIRIPGGSGATLVTTVVSSRPVAFRADEAKVSER